MASIDNAIMAWANCKIDEDAGDVPRRRSRRAEESYREFSFQSHPSLLARGPTAALLAPARAAVLDRFDAAFHT